ncbi:MAG: protein kinase [Bryobacteraceae bacterium]|nr:protein kinase [Bryobacteraceae bacterium]
MTPERFQRTEEIFQAAIDLDGPARKAFLDEKCGEDARLRADVESLLNESGVNETLLAGAVLRAAQSLESAQSTRDIGQRIGNYRLIREIGRGGMGAVYQAIRADDEFLQSVAIKLLQRGLEDDFLLARFRAERQILATLQHPNIAQLLDGGTASDGRPYLVIEYIEGEPLLPYCRKRNLNIRERLELFRSVCSAVHYAHQKLVIHRDIKPGNVLVNGEGVPKLLDFGIAKLLAPELIAGEMPKTLTDVRLMTPGYASPEQIRGELLTTSTDVYSLGVVLYELLSDQRPFPLEGKSSHELELAVCSTEARPPSSAASDETLRKQIGGELDTIVLMAMHKEPERRYPSAQALADDLLRYLRGEPVSARKDTLLYRTGKLIRRNPLAFATLALLIVSLIGGMATTLYQARRAEQRFAQVRKLANSFLFDFHDRIRDLPGSTEARAYVLQQAVQYLDSLAAEAGRDLSLKQELAEAYVRVGDALGDPRGANLGKSREARESYQKAIRLGADISAALPTNHAALRVYSDALARHGDILSSTGKSMDGQADLLKSVQVAEDLNRLPNPSAKDVTILVSALNRTGDHREDQDPEEAMRLYQRAAQKMEDLLAREPLDEHRLRVVQTYDRIARAAHALGDAATSIANYRRAIPIVEELSRRNPNNTRYQRQVSTTYGMMANYLGNPDYLHTGQRAAMLANQRKSLDILLQMHKADPNDRLIEMDVALRREKIARALVETDPAAALREAGLCVEITARLWKEAPANVRYRRAHSNCRAEYAKAQLAAGAPAQAIEVLTQSLTENEQMLRGDPSHLGFGEAVVSTHMRLCEAYTDLKQYARAASHCEQATAGAGKYAAQRPRDLYFIRDAGNTHEVAARLAAASGNREQCRLHLRKAREAWLRFSSIAKSSVLGREGLERVDAAERRIALQLTGR